MASERGPFPPRPGAPPDAAQLAALALRLDGAVAKVDGWMAAAGDGAEALDGVTAGLGALAETVGTLAEKVRAVGRAMEKEPDGPSLGDRLDALTKAVERNSALMERLVLASAEAKDVPAAPPPGRGG